MPSLNNVPREYPGDGVASERAIWRGLRLRIGEEEYSRVGLGSYSFETWLNEHKDERPEFRRCRAELRAWEYTKYVGDFLKACEYMQSEGYTGIYWLNGAWRLDEPIRDWYRRNYCKRATME